MSDACVHGRMPAHCTDCINGPMCNPIPTSGWTCPVCKAGVAPHIEVCPCSEGKATVETGHQLGPAFTWGDIRKAQRSGRESGLLERIRTFKDMESLVEDMEWSSTNRDPE